MAEIAFHLCVRVRAGEASINDILGCDKLWELSNILNNKTTMWLICHKRIVYLHGSHMEYA